MKGALYLTALFDTQDEVEAMVWLLRSAEQGHVEAQHNLGSSYWHGNGCTNDVELSISWYRKAAEQGYARSQALLGMCYLHGVGVEKDVLSTVSWYRIV